MIEEFGEILISKDIKDLTFIHSKNLEKQCNGKDNGLKEEQSTKVQDFQNNPQRMRLCQQFVKSLIAKLDPDHNAPVTERAKAKMP